MNINTLIQDKQAEITSLIEAHIAKPATKESAEATTATLKPLLEEIKGLKLMAEEGLGDLPVYTVVKGGAA